MLPKAEALLRCFTDSERRRISAAAKAHKRKSLSRLFRYLLKVIEGNAIFDKEAAFRAAFGRTYSTGKDYLLRNELRLAVGLMHEFLQNNELQRECESNPNFKDTMLLSALLRHHCFDELKHLFPKVFSSSIKNLDFEQARRQADIYFQYLIFHQTISPEILYEARSLMNEQLRILKILYRTGALLNMNNRRTCDIMLSMANSPIETPTEHKIDTDFSGIETPFIQYIEAMFASQCEPDFDKRIELVRSAADFISTVQHIYPVEKQLALGTLATLHYITKDYSRAREVFEEALAYAREAALPETINLVELLHNYISTLIWLERYNDALCVMGQYAELIARHEKLALRFDGFRCFCYIFLRRPADAFAAISHRSTHQSEYEHIYFRFIYAIIPYLSGDIETAHRESINLVDYFSRHAHNSLYSEQKFVASALRKFYSILLGSPDDIPRKLQQLSDQFDIYSTEQHGISDTFFLTWLRRESNSIYQHRTQSIHLKQHI